MRRYQQLLLVAIAFLSLVLFLVYERKYSKVRFVLQYMDVFGTRPDVNTCKVLLKSSGILTEPKKIAANTTYGETGIPVWQEIISGCFVYSAFWDSSVHEVKAIALARDSVFQHLKCSVWHYKAIEPLQGHVSVATKKRDGSSVVAIVSCKPDTETQVPYRVSFFNDNGNFENTITIPVLSSKSTGVISKNVSACVNGLTWKMKLDTMLIEFLEYHSHIGINYFVLYDQGLHPLLRNLLQTHAVKADFTLEILPWNLPHDFSHLSDVAYEEDCHYRSLFSASHFLRLSANQFVVPQDQALADIIDYQDFYTRAVFSVKLFCNEFDSDIVAKTLGFPFQTLKKTKYIEGTNSVQILFTSEHFLSTLENSFKSSPSSSVVGAVHVYGSCGKLAVKNDKKVSHYLETSMLKWKTLYFKSALYLAYIDEVTRISN